MSRGRSQEGSLIVCVRQSLTSAILSKSERLAEAAINETSHALSRQNGAPKRSNLSNANYLSGKNSIFCYRPIESEQVNNRNAMAPSN